MKNEKTPDGKATHKPQGLRDSIVMRLKAHDAAVRSTFDTVFGEDFDDGFGDDVGVEVGFSGEDEEDEEEVHDRER